MKLLGLPWALLSSALLQPGPGAAPPAPGVLPPEPGSADALVQGQVQTPRTHREVSAAPPGAPASAAPANATQVNGTAPLGAIAAAHLASNAQAWDPHADTARLVGLAHHAELNGRAVQVLGKDKPSGLVIVQLQGGKAGSKAFKVSAAHLAPAAPTETARLTGMVKDPSLNGLVVQVLGFDKPSTRFVVKLPDGSERKVKEEHLASPEEDKAQAPEEATIVGMVRDQSLNGQVVQVLAMDEKSGRYVVKLADGSEKKVAKEHLAAAPTQDSAVLVGMSKDRSLNGIKVHVLGFDKDSQRYVVELPDRTKRKVTEEHLADADAPPKPEGPEAKIVGMSKDKSLNGAVVHVVGVDKDTSRFVVRFPDGKMRKVAEEHLADLSATAPQGPTGAVDATWELGKGRAERVEVLGFDSESSRFLVANKSGTQSLVGLDALDGLANTSAKALAEMAIVGKKAATMPQLTVCNTYPSRAGLSVVLRHGPNRTDDLLVGSNLAFASCVDMEEFPAERGTLVFLHGKIEVGSYPFLVHGAGAREILLVHRADVNSEEAAVLRSVVKAKPAHGQVIVVNAAAGFELVGMAARFKGAEHGLRFNQLYDLVPGHYDLSLTAPTTRLAAGLDVSVGKTYVVAATGVAQGLRGEPTPVGLFIHGVNSFDVAEASPLASPPRAKPRVFLQTPSAAAAAGLLLLGLLG